MHLLFPLCRLIFFLYSEFIGIISYRIKYHGVIYLRTNKWVFIYMNYRFGCFRRNLSGRRIAYNAFDKSYDRENEGHFRGTEFLHLMDEQGVRANSQTYLWLLDFCLNSGSFAECKKLHGKIVKAGFDRERVLCDKLIDFYLAEGDLDSVVQVFDDMPTRSMITWHKGLSGLIANKMSDRVLSRFSQMVEENVNPSEVTFGRELNAENISKPSAMPVSA